VLTPREIWDWLGGGDDPPPTLGRYGGPLLILGGGRCVWQDLARAAPWSGDVMAINEIGQHYAGRLRHWVTLHPEYMPGWLAWRLGHCMGEGARPETHSSRGEAGIDRVWPALASRSGTGGLAAPIVGLMLGYAPVVLGGVPMDDSGHYFDPPGHKTPEFGDGAVRAEWRQAIDVVFAGRVTSLSGNTRAWLGAPAFLKEAA